MDFFEHDGLLNVLIICSFILKLFMFYNLIQFYNLINYMFAKLSIVRKLKFLT